jgi:hypothetical protein
MSNHGRQQSRARRLAGARLVDRAGQQAQSAAEMAGCMLEDLRKDMDFVRQFVFLSRATRERMSSIGAD